MTLLKVEKLSAFYHNLRALDEISLTVSAGELISVIGPNGAGKSTLLRAISGMVKTSGILHFDGQSIASANPETIVKRGVIQCAEGRQLFPDMTVQENLRLGAFLRRDNNKISRDMDRIHDLLPILYERREQKAGTLSGGEQQMLAIGRALMSSPRILLLDEPSFGIAPIIVDRIFDVIKRLNAEGLTTLLVEQNVNLALDVSDRSYVLESGRIVLSGSAAEIASNPSVREAYLGM